MATPMQQQGTADPVRIPARTVASGRPSRDRTRLQSQRLKTDSLTQDAVLALLASSPALPPKPAFVQAAAPSTPAQRSAAAMQRQAMQIRQQQEQVEQKRQQLQQQFLQRGMGQGEAPRQLQAAQPHTPSQAQPVQTVAVVAGAPQAPAAAVAAPPAPPTGEPAAFNPETPTLVPSVPLPPRRLATQACRALADC